MITKNMRKIAYIAAVSIILVFVVVALVPSTVKADTPLSASLRVYPVKIEMPVIPGKESSSIVNVENTADYPIDMRVYAQDFTIDKNGKYKFIEKEQPKSISTASWMSYSEPKFTLLSHETKKITVKLKAPKNIEPGGHYTIVFFEATPQITSSNRPKEAYMLMNTRVGALILGSAGGKVKHDEKLKSFSIPKYNYNSIVPVGIVFENKGNIHASLNGNITFTSSSGKRLGKIPIENRTSFPSMKLNIKEEWTPTIKIGRVTATVQLESLDGRKWKRSKTFFVIPLKQLGIGLAAIIIFCAVAFVARKKFSFRFRIERRQENSPEKPSENPIDSEDSKNSG